MKKAANDKKKPFVEVTDLRPLCRDSEKAFARVKICVNNYATGDDWLLLGQVQLQELDNHQKKGQWRLSAYLGDATDPEHDSAYILRLPLIGLTFEHAWYHCCEFTAWVDPNQDQENAPRHGGNSAFRVPLPGYDPSSLKGSYICTHKNCEKQHLVVPEGYYCPPFDAGLYAKVRGKKVRIEVGIPYEKEEPEEDDE